MIAGFAPGWSACHRLLPASCNGHAWLNTSTAQPLLRASLQLGADGGLRVHAAQQSQMAAAVARVQAVLQEGRYLHLPYTTLFEYLKVGDRSQSCCAALSIAALLSASLRCAAEQAGGRLCGRQAATGCHLASSCSLQSLTCNACCTAPPTHSTCTPLPARWRPVAPLCSSTWRQQSPTSSCPGPTWCVLALHCKLCYACSASHASRCSSGWALAGHVWITGTCAVAAGPVCLPLRAPPCTCRRSTRFSRLMGLSRSHWKRCAVLEFVGWGCDGRYLRLMEIRRAARLHRHATADLSYTLSRAPAVACLPPKAGAQDAGRAAARVEPPRHGGVLQAGNRHPDPAAEGKEGVRAVGREVPSALPAVGWGAWSLALCVPGASQQAPAGAHASHPVALASPSCCPCLSLVLPRRPTAPSRHTVCTSWLPTSCTHARTVSGW